MKNYCKHVLSSSFFTFFFFLTGLLLMPGCNPDYNNGSFNALSKNMEQNTTQAGITIQAKKLSKHEAARVLGSRAAKLYSSSKPIIPIAFTIENNSSNTIAFDLNNIDLPLVDTHIVQDRMKYNRFWRVFGVCIGGLLAIPNVLMGIGRVACGTTQYTVDFDSEFSQWDPRRSRLEFPAPTKGLIACGSAAFLTQLATPFVAYSYNKSIKEANEEIKQDVLRKTIYDSCIIEPCKRKQCLFYTKGNLLTNQCSLCVRDLSNDRVLTFDLELIETPESSRSARNTITPNKTKIHSSFNTVEYA